MRASIWIMLTLLALGGCQRVSSPTAPAAMSLLTATGPSQEQRRDKDLAYEHTVSIALEPGVLLNRMKEIQEACAKIGRASCRERV